jgi:hypothetical protein
MAGPLHPLPVPDKRFDSVAIDFIGPLPKDDGFDTIVTMTDRLGADVQIVPCRGDMSAEDFAFLFFDKWYCENGCPLEIISEVLASLDETDGDQPQTIDGLSPTNGRLIREI